MARGSPDKGEGRKTAHVVYLTRESLDILHELARRRGRGTVDEIVNDAIGVHRLTTRAREKGWTIRAVSAKPDKTKGFVRPLDDPDID